MLQEVAAARHIVIMCGSATIDGYAFCLGVKSLKLSYTASPELQTLPSVIYLIERAGLRSKYTANLPERFSLEIRSLAELIDMFHTRQATDTRDKVYALLGMSSDDPEKAGLQPDYQISWEELFQQVVKFVLGKDISVNTSSQRAVIKSKGSILGQVSSVSRNDRQRVTITVRNKAWDLGREIEWTLQASAKPIQEHDIICLLRGALKPTIIRLYKDHFAVIMIAATPLNGDSSFRWPATFYLTTQFCRDFLLVWDWEDPRDMVYGQEKYKILTKIYIQALGYSKVELGDLHEVTRFWNDIMILDDLGEFETAEERLVQARSGYARAFGKELLPKLNWDCGRTLLSFAAGEGHDDIIRLLLEKGAEIEVKGGKYNYTPLSWAARNGHEAVVKLLLDKGAETEVKDNKFGRTSLLWAAENGHKAVVKLLLEKGAETEVKEDKFGRTSLLWAAENGHVAVVKLLLEKGAETEVKDNDFGRTSLLWAARNGHEAVVKLLLEKGAEIEAKENDFGRTSLLWAARNGHEAVVKLLLEKGAEIKVKEGNYSFTPLFWAAENGHKAVVKLLLDKGPGIEVMAEY